MADSRIVVADGPAERLDRWLRRALPGVSRRLAAQLIADGTVRLDGRRARKGSLVVPGARVELPEALGLAPNPALDLEVLHEDASLVAVDKPGGMPSHPNDPRERDTAANFLLARYPETADLGGGLVHRLDTGTSGVLLAARSRAAWEATRRAFRERRVEKHYTAIVAGRAPAEATVQLALAHDPSDRRRMVGARAGLRAWPAESRITRIAERGDASVVAVVMRTGVTHQIRAHLASLGHPVLGDRLYGGPASPLAPGRHALHARALIVPATAASPALEIRSPFPSDLRQLAPDVVC
jgi:23S rRNA pseudouridine1911/1915/1917 synthase